MRRLSFLKGNFSGLILALLVALAHGLVYVFLMPPWQHYDEPNHFEYVWLIAHRDRLPRWGDYDLEMRREVARSMIQHGFFKGLGSPPSLDPSSNQPAWIGDYPQLADPPLYYLAASLPVRLISVRNAAANIDAQLYAARLVSLILYLISIFAAWGIAVELSAPESPWRWWLPLCLALIPAFADLMTAVNDDAGAVVVFSLFLWGAIRLLRRGFSWPAFLWATAAAGLGIWTKNTTWPALPLLGVAIWLVWIGKSRQKALGSGLIALIICLGVILLVFSWGDAALWARGTDQISLTRSPLPTSPVGKFALRIDLTPDPTFREISHLQQLIPGIVRAQLSGNTVTYGAWIWASRPLQINSPILRANSQVQFSQVITITETPRFFSFTARLPEDLSLMQVDLLPLWNSVQSKVSVYYDGLVLIKGEFPLGTPPSFKDSQALHGAWGGQTFTNLLRNASAEQSWPRVNQRADQLVATIFPNQGHLSTILYSILDFDAYRWYYRESAKNMLKTFWAKFGWGNISLLNSRAYWLLAGLTLLGILGMPFAIWNLKGSFPWREALFLALAVFAVWISAFLRGSIYVFFRPLIPAARYAFPSIIPVLIFLGTGWHIWGNKARYVRIGSLVALTLLSGYSILSISTFFARLP